MVISPHRQSESNDSPTVVVVFDPDEGPPEGLSKIEDRARVLCPEEDQELARRIPEADILLVTDFRTSVVEELWPEAKRLKWVHATMAGVDALLFDDLVESDVVLTNARGIFDRSIAEYCLGSIIAFAKLFPENFRLKEKKEWKHRDSERILGKKVLVVGVGGIGRWVGRLTGAVGMKPSGVARTARKDEDFETIVASKDLLEHLAEADYVVVSAPLTEETEGMFGIEQFRAMKPTARLINVGRGPIVRTDDLVRALREGEIAGAALDVFEEEPLPLDHPLWSLPNVMISFHMAGDFIGWRESLVDQFSDNLDRHLSGARLFNIVDKQRGYIPTKKKGKR